MAMRPSNRGLRRYNSRQALPRDTLAFIAGALSTSPRKKKEKIT